MKKSFFFILFLFHIGLHGAEANRQLDSLLLVLDESIKERSIYSDTKIQTIRDLETRYSQSQFSEERFDILGYLFEEYKNFQMDSTLQIANRRLQVALEENNPRHKVIAELNRAEVMVVTGMYKEVLDILDRLDRSVFTNEETAYIHHLYHSLYMLMAEYSITQKEKEEYLQLEYQYKDSILQTINDPDDVGYKMVESSKLATGGKEEEALALGFRILEDYKEDNRVTAMTAYTIAKIYGNRGEILNQKNI